MSRQKQHLKFARINKFKKIYLQIVLLIVIFYISYRLFNEVLSNLDTNKLLTLLNILLLTVTSFYAFVTYKMFRTMQETQTGEIKPQLWINFDYSKIISDDENKKILVGIYNVSNFGKGPAINVNVKIEIPHDENPDTKKREYIVSNYKHDTALKSFLMNSDYSFKKDIFIPINNLYFDENGRNSDFAEVIITYEDMERNFYEITQYYDMLNLAEEKKYWSLLYQELNFINYKKRNSSGAESSIIGNKKELIYRL